MDRKPGGRDEQGRGRSLMNQRPDHDQTARNALGDNDVVILDDRIGQPPHALHDEELMPA